MKKLLALMLAAALALSLVACGGGGGTGDNNTPSTGNGDTTSTDTPSGGEENSKSEESDANEEIPELSIGETTTVGEIEFTLNWVEIGELLDGDVSSDNCLKTPDEAITQRKLTPENDTKVLAGFSITAKNLGKETCTFNLENCFALDYNDGYKFNCDNTYTFTTKIGQWAICKGLNLEPLSEATEFRGVIEIPKEVMENTDTELKFLANVDVKFDDIDPVQVIYIIR